MGSEMCIRDSAPRYYGLSTRPPTVLEAFAHSHRDRRSVGMFMIYKRALTDKKVQKIFTGTLD